MRNAFVITKTEKSVILWKKAHPHRPSIWRRRMRTARGANKLISILWNCQITHNTRFHFTQTVRIDCFVSSFFMNCFQEKTKLIKSPSNRLPFVLRYYCITYVCMILTLINIMTWVRNDLAIFLPQGNQKEKHIAAIRTQNTKIKRISHSFQFKGTHSGCNSFDIDAMKSLLCPQAT